MNRLLSSGVALSVLVAATPVLAQSHGGHGQHGATPAQSSAPAGSAPCTPEHAAMGHCLMSDPSAGVHGDAGCTPEHAEMGHCTMQEPAPGESAGGCPPEHAAMGHCAMSGAEPASPPAEDPDCPAEHATMGHCTPATGPGGGDALGTNLPAGDLPAPRPVAANYADRVWGQTVMQPARDALRREHGGGTFSQVMIDLAEVKIADGHEGYKFESDFWFGGDINRFVFKADGEGELGEPIGSVELKALYSRAIGPYFNFQAGVRQDLGVGPDRTHAVVGVEGLAPYWLEVDGYVYFSTEGEVRASASAEYDQRITQRLILQPKVEFDLSAQDIPELGLGAGLTSAEAGLRLRYEFMREFAPYVGIVHETKLGRTADLARIAGEDASSINAVVGIRAWF